MLRNLLNNKYKFFVVVCCVLLLVLVRVYEQQLFYDPFLIYFKSEFNALPLPLYDGFGLFFGLLCRYVANSVLSLILMYILFSDLEMIKFISFLYVFLFGVLIAVFFGVLYFSQTDNQLLIFYIRRFLIQPIFVLLFIPAFYYQKMNK